MKLNQTRLAGVALLCACVLLSACEPRQKPAVRIGLNHWPGYEYLFLAEHLGYFREEGVNVRLVEFVSLGDSRRAFERGQIDAWGATTTEMLLSRGYSRRQAQAFYVTNVSNGADVILARKGINNTRQLKGARVGLEPATVAAVLLDGALRAAGLAIGDVKVVHLAVEQYEDAIRRGKVDAVCAYPPFSSHIVRSGIAKRIFDSSDIPNTIVDVLAADAASLAERPADYAAIVRAHDRALQFSRTHEEESLRVLARYAGLEVAEYRKALAGIEMLGLGDQDRYLTAAGRLAPAFALTYTSLHGMELLQDQPPANLWSAEVVTRAFKK